MTADRDERLAQLIDEQSADQRRGETVDLTGVAAAHPDLFDEFKALWAAHQLAAALASPSVTAAHVPTVRTPAPAPESFGDFEVLRELGRGGMGVVYLARQKSLDRLIALKMVLHGNLASDSDRARFRIEAGASAKLVHPGIVTVHEVGEHEGRPFFVMQYIEGETLAARLSHGPLPGRGVARIVATVARAVDYAHRQGILHRDLKPSNVLIDKANAPHVTDFGLAKQMAVDGQAPVAALTVTGAVMGTPSYMAPEQAAAGKDLGPPVDVHALGAILYEALTGRPPFQAANALDTMLLVLEQEPVPPRLLNPSVERELETICLKCLEKSPRRRFATAAALAADLEAFQAGDAISATPSGLGYFLDRVFRESHHAAVLENWGVLWMWHSLAIFSLCLLTQVLEWSGYGGHVMYLLLWAVGLSVWGSIFWSLRRRGGPVRFVERQVAHAWAAGVCASVGMFLIEVIMKLPPLTLSPVLAIAAGMIFLFKAGVLAGIFYIATAVMFATALVMAALPEYGVLLFGLSAAGCFFFPGLKYYRQMQRRS